MNIQAKKIELVQLILNTQAPSILEKIESLFKKEKEVDWWDTLSEQAKEELDESIAQADRGELITHEEVRQKIKEKFNF